MEQIRKLSIAVQPDCNYNAAHNTIHQHKWFYRTCCSAIVSLLFVWLSFLFLSPPLRLAFNGIFCLYFNEFFTSCQFYFNRSIILTFQDAVCIVGNKNYVPTSSNVLAFIKSLHNNVFWKWSVVNNNSVFLFQSHIGLDVESHDISNMYPLIIHISSCLDSLFCCQITCYRPFPNHLLSNDLCH